MSFIEGLEKTATGRNAYPNANHIYYPGGKPPKSIRKKDLLEQRRWWLKHRGNKGLPHKPAKREGFPLGPLFTQSQKKTLKRGALLGVAAGGAGYLAHKLLKHKDEK